MSRTKNVRLKTVSVVRVDRSYYLLLMFIVYHGLDETSRTEIVRFSFGRQTRR